VVALLEPFIDTLIICTMTGLVIVSTGAWDMHHKTQVDPTSSSYTYTITNGEVNTGSQKLYFSNRITENGSMQNYDAPADTMFTEATYSIPVTGHIKLSNPDINVTYTVENIYTEEDTKLSSLYGGIIESCAPLTVKAFQVGLSPLFNGAGHILTI